MAKTTNKTAEEKRVFYGKVTDLISNIESDISYKKSYVETTEKSYENRKKDGEEISEWEIRVLEEGKREIPILEKLIEKLNEIEY